MLIWVHFGTRTLLEPSGIKFRGFESLLKKASGRRFSITIFDHFGSRTLLERSGGKSRGLSRCLCLPILGAEAREPDHTLDSRNFTSGFF